MFYVTSMLHETEHLDNIKDEVECEYGCRKHDLRGLIVWLHMFR